MAQDQVAVNCAGGAWTQITNGNVTSITFQVLEGSVSVRYTAGANAPTLDAEGYVYDRREGELNTAIADLTNLSGANRVYVKPLGQSATVFVDHA